MIDFRCKSVYLSPVILVCTLVFCSLPGVFIKEQPLACVQYVKSLNLY